MLSGGADLIIVYDRADAKGKCLGVPLADHTSQATKLKRDLCDFGG
jgi:hypothetical protein